MTKIELLTYSTLFTNDLICANVIEVIAALKKEGFYKHDFKQKVNELHALRRRYESVANFKLRKFEEEFADANDYVSELVSDDIERLRLFILSKINDHPKAEISKMMLIDVLCSISDAQYKFLLSIVRSSDFNFLSIKNICNVNRTIINYLVNEKTTFDATAYVMPIITKLCSAKTVEKVAV